jgi:hypothetical protein
MGFYFSTLAICFCGIKISEEIKKNEFQVNLCFGVCIQII